MTYQLYQGDCLDIMPTLKKGSVDMVFADLPYALKTTQVTANYWDRPIDIDAVWRAIKVTRKENAACIFTAKMAFAASLLFSNPKEFKHDLIFIKSRLTRHHHAKRMPLSAHEHVLVFAAKQHTYNPKMELRDKPRTHLGVNAPGTNYTTQPNLHTLKGRIYTHKFPTTVLSIASENGRLHPTQKPVALLEWLIATYTNPGDTVLDPCFGSATTGVACARLGRNFIGIEKDPIYFAVGKARLEAEHARLALEVA